MRWALIDLNNKVTNIIEYNGTDPYKAAPGITLRQVQDWIEIGNDVDAVKPIEKPILDEAESKVNRNKIYKMDLSLVALFLSEKKSNPDITFSNYIDNLELAAKSLRA